MAAAIRRANLPFRHVASLALVVAASLPAALPPVHYADHFRIPTRPLMTAALHPAEPALATDRARRGGRAGKRA
ncbi:MAG: hypothetical protein E5W04_34110, partial [Mesorhizobium sp.]